MPDDPTIKEIRDLDRLIRSPDWVIPDGVHTTLPKVLYAYLAKHKEAFVNGKRNRDYARIMRMLEHMDNINKAREPVAPLEHIVHIDRDVDQAIEELADLPVHELEALAAAAPILERLERARQQEGN